MKISFLGFSDYRKLATVVYGHQNNGNPKSQYQEQLDFCSPGYMLDMYEN